MNTHIHSTVSKIKVLVLAVIALSVVHCSKGGGGSTSTPATTAGTCVAGQVYTNAGCLTSCGTNMVYYNNQCVSATSIPTTFGTTGTGTCQPTYVNGQMTCNQSTGTQGALLCQGQCGSGMVQTANGCLPQGACGACYGQNNGWCYIGTYAHQYYGY